MTARPQGGIDDRCQCGHKQTKVAPTQTKNDTANASAQPNQRESESYASIDAGEIVASSQRLGPNVQGNRRAAPTTAK